MSDFKAKMQCTKIVFGWGSAPDPARGAYDASPNPLVGWEGIGTGRVHSRALRKSGQKILATLMAFNDFSMVLTVVFCIFFLCSSL